jgi:hypothetical protein
MVICYLFLENREATDYGNNPRSSNVGVNTLSAQMQRSITLE